jgi:hypothetical protein
LLLIDSYTDIHILSTALLLIFFCALLLVGCGTLLFIDSIAHLLVDCRALLIWNSFADNITDRETLWLYGNMQLGSAKLHGPILTVKIADSRALLLSDWCTLDLLDSCTHTLTARTALLLLDSLHLSFTFRNINISTHLLLCLPALLLLYINTLLLCVWGTLLLMQSDTNILILAAALLLMGGAAHFFIHSLAVRTFICYFWKILSSEVGYSQKNNNSLET